MDRSSGNTMIVSNTGVLRSDSTQVDTVQVKMESRSAQEERRARKREQDRLCQRRKREKDRENLRRLEARLNGLQKADDSKTVLDLILRHEQDQAKIDRQVERLRQLQSVLKAGLSDLAKDATGASSSNSKDDDSTPESEDRPDGEVPRLMGSVNGSMGAIEGVTGAGNPQSNGGYSMTGNPVYSGQMYTDYSGTSALPADTIAGIVPAFARPDISVAPDAPSAPWMFAGNMIENACKRAKSVPGANVSTAESIDQHIILTVALHGWDQALPFIEPNHALWTCLRQVDEVVLSTWNIVARMSSLWSMWKLMKANAQGPQATSSLEPKFLRPRPSQIHVPHRPDIDYFVWPGFRERLVFNQDKYYSSETFLQCFSASTSFLWPFSLNDTYYEDTNTRLLQFSPEIMRRFYNINYWSIDSAFMVEYPEFMGDIPIYNSVPPKVDDKYTSNQYFYHQEEEQNVNPMATNNRVGNWVMVANGFAAAPKAGGMHGSMMMDDKTMMAANAFAAPKANGMHGYTMVDGKTMYDQQMRRESIMMGSMQQ